MRTLKDMVDQLQQLQKQVPFATAQAMTSVVRQIEAAQKKAFERHFESPTPFTVRSVGSVAARKNNLCAKVFVRDKAAEYLEPFEFGGQHKLNSKVLLNPKNIKLNKYGNLPRRKLSQLKEKSNVFIGEVKDVYGVWERKKSKVVKSRRIMARGSNGVMEQVGWKRRKRSKNGTRQARLKTRAPKLLIHFGDALPVKPTLGYMERANAMAKALLQTALNQAMAEAIRKAK